MYYLDVFFFLADYLRYVFCILYCYYNLCYLLVQMHQRVSVDE